MKLEKFMTNQVVISDDWALFRALIYILNPAVWSFFGIAQYAWMEAGNDLFVPHHAIKIRLT